MIIKFFILICGIERKYASWWKNKFGKWKYGCGSCVKLYFIQENFFLTGHLPPTLVSPLFKLPIYLPLFYISIHLTSTILTYTYVVISNSTFTLPCTLALKKIDEFCVLCPYRAWGCKYTLHFPSSVRFWRHPLIFFFRI